MRGRALQERHPLQTADLTGDVETDEPLADHDDEVRAAIGDIAGAFDAAALLAIWRAAVAAPAWDRPPVWYHDDFHTGNLLTTAGKVTAVLSV